MIAAAYAISPAKLQRLLSQQPPAAPLQPAVQPSWMPALAETLTAPGWLERQHLRQEVMRRRAVDRGPWLTRQERRQIVTEIERTRHRLQAADFMAGDDE